MNKKNNFVKWYVFIRRVPFIPFFIVGVIFLMIATYCAYGKREAIKLWQSL